MDLFGEAARNPDAGRLKSTPIVPVPRVAASAEQRRKVATKRCAVCGRRPVDPAHLVPQRLGGCASPDCVIALCRTHHRLYDCRRLALAPYLGRGFRRERAHALAHVGATELRNALAGGGWPPPWSDQPEPRRSER
jgi:HNH endonuclease